MKRSNRRAVRAIASVCALTGTTVLSTTAAAASTSDAGTTTPAPSCAVAPTLPGAPGITITNPNCDSSATNGLFASLHGSRVWAGTIVDNPAGGVTLQDGKAGGGTSGYRVEVPRDWNGTLVMFAHGYAGTGTTVAVSDPNLRQWFVDHGYAWAASSYAMNGYDVGTGVVDTHDLLEAFPSITGLQPKQVIMSGLSMGGAITVVSIEHYRNTFVGAMPYCGVLGGNDLFNFFLGANVTAAAVTGTNISFPTTLAGAASYVNTYGAQVAGELPALGIGSTGGLTHKGKQWETAVENISGGTRPGFNSALSYWDSFGFAPLTSVPFLFGLYPGLTAGGIGFLPGNVTDNEDTVYNFGGSSESNAQLNAKVLRVERSVPFSTNPSATELPDVTGTPGVPVVSVHGIGDLFVPFSMEQDYARLADAHGQGNLFVSRAIREVTHCGYNNTELASAFSALTKWIRTGHRAAGDAILDPRVVSSPHFGCRFTVGTHPYFQGATCPTGPAAKGHGREDGQHQGGQHGQQQGEGHGQEHGGRAIQA